MVLECVVGTSRTDLKPTKRDGGGGVGVLDEEREREGGI